MLLPAYIKRLFSTTEPLGLLFRAIWWTEHPDALHKALVDVWYQNASGGRGGEVTLKHLSPKGWSLPDGVYVLDNLPFQVEAVRPRSPRTRTVIDCPMCPGKWVTNRRTGQKELTKKSYEIKGLLQHARTHIPQWIKDHYKTEVIMDVEVPMDHRRVYWIKELLVEAWGNPDIQRNPLRAKHEGVQAANPVPPDVEEIFKTIMGRGLRPEDHEGIHAALYARISIEYAFTAAEANGSAPALVTLDKTGLTPVLDAEGIAIKRLLSREYKMLVSLIEMVDSDQPATPIAWLEAANVYYEYEDINPIAILTQQLLWRPAEELVTSLKSWIRHPSDLGIMDLIGSQRYLEDISASHIVAIEELQMIDDKMQIKPLYARADAQQTSPNYLYHGTTVKSLREALAGEITL